MWAVGDGTALPREHGRLPTTTPRETLERALECIKALGAVDAVGVGAFGPLNRESGTVLETPKDGWRGAEVLSIVRELARVPVGIDTDVNAAALGEHRLGAAHGLDDFVYLTVGTGIGGGAMVAGALVGGAAHPEMGHVHVGRHPRDVAAGFEGVCPYHPHGCLEGLASGTAIAARHGAAAEELAGVDEVWEIEAHYLALAIANLVVTLRPQRIIVGGGVMATPRLRERVAQRVAALVNPRYVDVGDGSEFVRPPGLGNLSGVSGAILIAKQARRAG